MKDFCGKHMITYTYSASVSLIRLAKGAIDTIKPHAFTTNYAKPNLSV